MKFEIYERYLAEGQERAEKGGELQRKATDAQAELDRLEAEYEAVMTKAIKEERDQSSELDILDDKIEKAKRQRDRALRERKVYGHVSRGISITRDDIIAAWNKELNPQHYEKKIAPTLVALEKTKQAYFKAMCDYFDSVREIKDFREVVSSQLGYDFPYHFHINELATRQEYDRYFIEQGDFAKAQARHRD